jgi:small subunit ribosomal protein S8
MMTDPLADMLTRIRNANRIERAWVDIPANRLKINVAQVLKDEGFIAEYRVGRLADTEQGQKEFASDTDLSKPRALLRVWLNYGPEGERVIRRIARVSKPGLRVYRSASELRPVLEGLGIAILSTSKGVMSDRRARSQKVGGEVLCEVW